MTLNPVATMEPTAKQLWVEALRSEEYGQTKGALQNDDGYCCLGVLCEVAIKAGVPIEVTTNEDGVRFYDGNCEHLPEAVYQWAGLPSASPTAIITEDEGDGEEEYEREFVMLNDDFEWSFGQIADLVDAQL